MPRLRKMKAREFPAYRDYFIAEYSAEIADNYGHSIEAARAQAEKDLQRCFPDGPDSGGHTLLCIETGTGPEPEPGQEVIGYLWYSVSSTDNSGFIYDFYIASEYRGRGYGRRTLDEFEQLMQGKGIAEIKLRVAYSNNRALKLYQESGFVITGYNMAKTITGGSSE